MCTAVRFGKSGRYVGRTMDYNCSFGEQVVVTPRHFRFPLRHRPDMETHYALIGMGMVAEGLPMYYDAVNEKGLSMAGLNFPGYAQYAQTADGACCVATFELLPWILGQCADLRSARQLLETMTLVGEGLNEQWQPVPLHWIVADKTGCITVESTADGITIYDNPVGVMTNSPDFAYQMTYLSNYMQISSRMPENRLAAGRVEFTPYCVGLGGFGMPGDASSSSRFVRAAFTNLHAAEYEEEQEQVSQCFHILGSVEMVEGCVDSQDGSPDKTLYTSCWDSEQGIYYYTTYGNHQISAVAMHGEDLDGSRLSCFPLRKTENIYVYPAQNGILK